MSKSEHQLVEAMKAVAMKFVEAINNGDSKALIKLQTEDFTLIDVEGEIFRGRDGLEGYFQPIQNIRSMHSMS